MLKYLAVALILVTQVALANRDSIGYFYSSKKVNILLNERIYDSRISKFLDVLGENGELVLISSNKDIKLGCAVRDMRSTCTFTFYPSESVKFIDKKLFVKIDVNEIGISEDVEFSMSFQGSMKDQMQLSIRDGVLTIFASK